MVLQGIEATAGAGTLALVRQQVEYVRRRYARATDLLGTAKPAAIAEGTQIYHEIFTPDADLRTSGGTAKPFQATGPGAWADVVVDALEEYSATQHLIGTQLVHIDQLTEKDGSITAGHATMSSYLQAWHSTDAGKLWMFIGTYEDQVRYVPGKGWQIYAMNLIQVSGENRQLAKD
jgi:hypothetical protein